MRALRAGGLVLLSACVSEKEFSNVAPEDAGDVSGEGDSEDVPEPSDGGEIAAPEPEAPGCSDACAAAGAFVCEGGGARPCSLDPVSGCLVLGAAEPCDDGLLCTGEESCADGAGCVAGAPPSGCCASSADCEDGDACNGQGQCHLGTGTCELTPALACDDGNPCNGVETCLPLAGCALGTPPPCGDGNLCNGVETCLPETGCAPGSVLACDDGLPCNGLESCDPAIGCVVGEPLAGCCKSQAQCEDGNVCNGVGACDDATDTCSIAPPGKCDDGNPCNGAEACLKEGGCQSGAPLACSDGNPCNGVEGCDAETGCTSGSPKVCDDGKACNGLESCDPVKGCLPGSQLACSDGNPCTGVETCDQELGCQGGAPVQCSDGNPCNGQESCDATLGCTAGAPLACDDGDACDGVETCDPAAGCKPAEAPDCDDGDACTEDACEAAKGCTNEEIDCADGDPCTADGCDEESGCTHAPGACDDGDACDGAETCDEEGCQEGTPLACYDEDACNGDEQCEPTTGCLPGTPLECDDGDACNGLEGCDTETGCTAGSDPACDDGNACNGAETCEAEAGCLPADPLECDDGDACDGAELCLAESGCAAGTPLGCDDGDACNGLEACDAETGCTAGSAVDCADGNACTEDVCAEDTGACSHPLAASCKEASWTVDYDVSFEYATTDLAEVKGGKATLAKGPPAPLDAASPGLGTLVRFDPDRPQPGSPGLLALWSFEQQSWSGGAGEVTDANGENPGTAFGGAVPTEGGLFGSAARLEGPAVIEIAANSVSVKGSFTAAAWVRIDPDAKAGRMSVLGQWPAREALDAGGFASYDAGATSGLDTTGYYGGAFDGRYVYFAPYVAGDGPSGRVLRYDTKNPFGAGGSWEAYDAASTGGLDTRGYWGAAFDGRYVYFSPAWAGAHHARVLRYDTTAAFADPGSWSARDADGTSGLPTRGYHGIARVGRHLYFAPYHNDTAEHGLVLRYDTALDFEDEEAWAAHDAGSTDGLSTKGYFGLVSDGRFVYFVPHNDGNNGQHGRVLRLDTEGAFDDPSSYDAYDASTTNALSTRGMSGGAFDGRYVWFAPSNDANDNAHHGRVLRHDTKGSFTSPGSWTAYDAAGTDALDTRGFHGAIFDGRHVLFAPSREAASVGFVLRADATLPFGSASSWSAFDAGQPVLDARGYRGAVFDGKYAYLAPFLDGGPHGRVLRYDTTADGTGWALLAARSSQDGGYSAGPTGPAALLETTEGRFAVTAPPLDRGWHHLATSWNGATLRLYVDGESAGFAEAPGTVDADEGSFEIGRGFDGLLDEVSMWAGALPAAQIAALGRPSARDDGPADLDLALDGGGAGTPASGAFGPSLSSRAIGDGVSAADAGALDALPSLTVEAWVEVPESGVQTPSTVAERFGHEASLEDLPFEATDAAGDAGTALGGYVGGAFDGRYVYLAPYRTQANYHGLVLRNDTRGPFAGAGAWDSYDAADTGGLDTRGFVGAVFDGRYVYFVPYTAGVGQEGSGAVLRYDTTKAFDDPASWDARNANPTDGLETAAFSGAVFDGRFVHFVPNGVDPTYDGRFLRYDTQGDFFAAGSWSAYDAAGTSGLDCRGYAGGTFDGRYAYFSPNWNGAPHAHVLRLDTKAPYKSASSWQAYDAASTGGMDTRQFSGAAFDGRFVYFGPSSTTAADPGATVRYDTRGAFRDPSSWVAFDAFPTGPFAGDSYLGLAFDGRYLWFAPWYDGADYHGRILRHDTTLPFEDATAWEVRDAHESSGGLATEGYDGIVFDGRHVVFVPFQETGDVSHANVLRVDTSAGEFTWALAAGLGATNGGHGGAPAGPTASIATTEGWFNAPAPEALEPGWHHLAMVWDGVSLDLYVDGALEGDVEAPGSLVETPAPFAAGGRGAGLGIDEVAVWADDLAAETLAARLAPYPVAAQAVTTELGLEPPSGKPIAAFTAFSAFVEEPPGTSVAFQLSTDGGAVWLVWEGAAWSPAGGLDDATDLETAAAHVAALEPGAGGLHVRAVLSTTAPGSTPVLYDVTVGYLYGP